MSRSPRSWGAQDPSAPAGDFGLPIGLRPPRRPGEVDRLDPAGFSRPADLDQGPAAESAEGPWPAGPAMTAAEAATQAFHRVPRIDPGRASRFRLAAASSPVPVWHPYRRGWGNFSRGEWRVHVQGVYEVSETEAGIFRTRSGADCLQVFPGFKASKPSRIVQDGLRHVAPRGRGIRDLGSRRRLCFRGRVDGPIWLSAGGFRRVLGRGGFLGRLFWKGQPVSSPRGFVALVAGVFMGALRTF